VDRVTDPAVGPGPVVMPDRYVAPKLDESDMQDGAI